MDIVCDRKVLGSMHIHAVWTKQLLFLNVMLMWLWFFCLPPSPPLPSFFHLPSHTTLIPLISSQTKKCSLWWKTLKSCARRAISITVLENTVASFNKLFIHCTHTNIGNFILVLCIQLCTCIGHYHSKLKIQEDLYTSFKYMWAMPPTTVASKLYQVQIARVHVQSMWSLI